MGKVIQRKGASARKASGSARPVRRGPKSSVVARGDTAAIRVRKAIRDCFPTARLEDFGRTSKFDRIGGVLIWSGFEGLDMIDRHEKLWSALKQKLSADDRAQCTLIMTLTPKELEDIQSD